MSAHPIPARAPAGARGPDQGGSETGTPSVLDRVATLQRLVALAAEAAVQQADATVLELCERIGRWLIHDGGAGHLDGICGLEPQPGARGWRDILAKAARDVALWEAAQCSGQCASSLARALARYHAGAWQNDRLDRVCPPHYAGQLQAHLWHALRAWPHVIGERQIREILRDRR